MNLTRTILDGTVLCIIFNAIVGLFFFVTPQGYSVMFPKGIREAAKPYVTRKDRRIMHWAIYPLMFLYMALSAHLAGVEGFRHFFWTGYIEMMFVNAGDFLLLLQSNLYNRVDKFTLL